MMLANMRVMINMMTIMMTMKISDDEDDDR